MISRERINFRGVTLIEAMIVLFVFSVVTLTFYSVWTQGLRFIIEAKNRLGAIVLLNERMEIMHNLPYESMGVLGGVPSGNIPEIISQLVNGTTYAIETHVSYVDDSFDGVYPADTIPQDYKVARVKISWSGVNGANSNVVGVGKFVPVGLETIDPNAGVLSINILDSSGAGVPQSTVQIINNDVSPKINMTRETDNFGNIMLPGVPQSLGNYYLKVSKSGYESINTLNATDAALIANNYIDRNVSVILGSLSMKTIIQDKKEDMKIKSQDITTGNSIANAQYHIKGGRILGVNGTYSVYNVDEDNVTGLDGQKSYLDQRVGQYFIESTETPVGYKFVTMSNIAEYKAVDGTFYYAFNLSSDSNEEDVLFASNSNNALKVNVIDSGGNVVNGASVQVTNSNGYNQTQTTKADGVAFFSEPDNGLVAGSYDVKVSAAGFLNKNTSVSVSGFSDGNVILSK